MGFEIILQEYSSGDPLPKLPKRFRSLNKMAAGAKNRKPLNDISSQANGPILKYFHRNDPLMPLY